MKIDHIFICTKAPEHDAKILTDFGLIEGPPNTHHKQGTANVRFFFENIYLEFLYIFDDPVAKLVMGAPHHLYKRLKDSGENTSPFGIGLYPSASGLKISDYNTLTYHPKFLPAPLKMDIYGSSLAEPMYYHMDYLSEASKIGLKKFSHKHNLNHVTAVILHTPDAELDNEFKKDMHQVKLLQFLATAKPSDKPYLLFEFDDLKSNKTHDFRPELPLMFKW